MEALLDHAGGVRGALRLQLAHGGDDRLRAEREAGTPAGHGVGLRERAEDDDVLFAVGEGAAADDRAGVGEIDVALIEQHVDAARVG